MIEFCFTEESSWVVGKGLAFLIPHCITNALLADITYIHTIHDGWCYLASVLDCHTKKIVGYKFGRKMTVDLVLEAFITQ